MKSVGLIICIIEGTAEEEEEKTQRVIIIRTTAGLSNFIPWKASRPTPTQTKVSWNSKKIIAKSSEQYIIDWEHKKEIRQTPPKMLISHFCLDAAESEKPELLLNSYLFA